MDLNLNGKRALVAGSSTGLGEATVVHGLEEERTEAVAEAILQVSGTATATSGDLATHQGAEDITRAATVDGPIDILVNNAGFCRHLSRADARPEEWNDTSAWEEIQPQSVQAFIPNDHSRYGRPDEIAAAVAYLCSDYAEYISGVTIRVDGGFIRSAF